MRILFVIFSFPFLVDRTYRPSSAWITLLSELYIHSSIGPEVQVSFGPETMRRPVPTLITLTAVAHEALRQHRLSKAVVSHDLRVPVVLDDERLIHNVASIVSAVDSSGGRSCRCRCCCWCWRCCWCWSCCRCGSCCGSESCCRGWKGCACL